MSPELQSVIIKNVIELVIVLMGIISSFIIFKVNQYLSSLKNKDILHTVDFITDRAVEVAEAQFKGLDGQRKLEFATSFTTQWLKQRGISVSDQEILAGIENGVNKLKIIQTAQTAFLTPSTLESSEITEQHPVF